MGETSVSVVAYLEELLARQAGAAVAIREVGPCGPPYPRAHVSIVHLDGPPAWGERLILKRYRNAESMTRECGWLDRARGVPLRVPTVLAQSDSLDPPIGACFVLMTDVGRRFLDEITPEEEPGALSRVDDGIVRLHAMTGEASHPPQLFPGFEPDRLRAHLAVAVPFLQARERAALAELATGVAAELSRRVDTDRSEILAFRPCVLHGDLHPSNLLLDEAGNVGFVDWLESRWGDPAFDLAYYYVRTLRLCFPDRASAVVAGLVARHVEACDDPRLPARLRFHVLATLLWTLRLCADWDRLDLADKTGGLLESLHSGQYPW